MSETKILQGTCASRGKVEGIVKIVTESNLSSPTEKGYILVCNQTNPAYLVLLMRSSGVITVSGGIVSHAAIVSRELGIPCIVGATDALTVLKDGQKIVLDATSGAVYDANK